MATFEIFSHPEYRRYKSSVCSLAVFVQIICFLLTIVPPFFIAYASEGFWQKLDTFEEQPIIRFKHQLLVVVETSSTGGDYVTWSTYPFYNQMQMGHLRSALVKSHEDDVNGDGRYDWLYFQLDMPLLDSEQVYGVKLILVFDYRLMKYARLQMESIAYIHYSSPIAGAALKSGGELRLFQGDPLASSGVDTRYNYSVINGSSIYAEAYDFYNIFQNYTERNMSTFLKNDLPVWVSGRGAGQPFVVTATIRYPIEYTILYTPGFWQTIKNGWIQYLAILLIFIFVFERVKIFIFQNQVVSTLVVKPSKQHDQ